MLLNVPTLMGICRLMVIALLGCNCEDADARRRNKSYEMVRKFRHDSQCFTQGLMLHHDGFLYESCGLYRQSLLRQLDPRNLLAVNAEIKFDNSIFAEGLTVVNNLIYMLTWTNKKVFVIDISSFQLVDVLGYSSHTNEGWGLTFDGVNLIASDGSSRLTFFKLPTNLRMDASVSQTLTPPQNLEPVREIIVRMPSNEEVNLLNELEYVDGFVYANVWYKDFIVKIDPSTGLVVKKYDMSLLYPMSARLAGSDCLNGIAYNVSNNAFILTGRKWHHYYEVIFRDSNRGDAGETTGNISKDL